MILAVYFSYVVPLVFLVIATKGEGRSLILLFAWGLTAALTVYGITDLLDAYSSIPLNYQLVYVIPGIEELIKILPLFLLTSRANRRFRYSLVRYALAAGIGFSILENYVYLSLVFSDGSSPALPVILRSLTACLMHGSASALIGLGLQYMRNHSFFSVLLLFGFYLAATALHGLYNLLGLSTVLAPAGFLLPLAVFTVELVALNAFGVYASRRVPAQQEGGNET